MGRRYRCAGRLRAVDREKALQKIVPRVRALVSITLAGLAGVRGGATGVGLAPLLLAGLSFSGYLLNTIASDVDNPCRLCLIAHAINVAACVMAFASMYLDRVAARLRQPDS